MNYSCGLISQFSYNERNGKELYERIFNIGIYAIAIYGYHTKTLDKLLKSNN